MMGREGKLDMAPGKVKSLVAGYGVVKKVLEGLSHG
jgi:hypothetical protein